MCIFQIMQKLKKGEIEKDDALYLWNLFTGNEDLVVKMPPGKRYSINLGVNSIKKAEFKSNIRDDS